MKLNSKDFAHIQQYFEGKPVPKAYLFGSYAGGFADHRKPLENNPPDA